MAAEPGPRAALLAAGLAAAVLAGCSGSTGSAGSNACVGSCQSAQNFLTQDDVRRVLAQAVGEAQARGVRATVAVVDRVGNVLAVFEMTGAPATIAITGGRGGSGGLDGIAAGTVPASLAAIAKAITGAYLSTEGHAFTTRTAGQIVQENFYPGESQQPSGPLFGVQFSQLSCSDVNRNFAHGSVGPKRSPLGLAADPGGIPLYRNGTVVGAIGVEADGLYTLDRVITDRDEHPEELVAVAGGSGFSPPDDRRADRITADGRTFRYVDSEAIASNPAAAPAFGALPGALIPVAGYVDAAVHAGTAFGTAASGVRADTGAFAPLGAKVLVNASDANRFPPTASASAGLAARDVEAIIGEALKVAARARGQIRRPLGSPAQVTVAVVDREGTILGLAQTADAPVFGIDVSAQKARGALLFSHPDAAAQLAAAAPVVYLDPPGGGASLAAYVAAMRDFVGASAGSLTGGVAWSTRAIGNLHRPTFPDGIADTPAGPLSKSYAAWSPFNVGFQLDLVHNQLVKGVLGSVETGCAGRASAGAGAGTPDAGVPLAANGVQIFPGGVPIYRGAQLVGAIGISGDGVDQDDMIAALGLANAGAALANGIGHAPSAMRPDTLEPLGTRLRYVQCPQSPFIGSTEQNACAGI